MPNSVATTTQASPFVKWVGGKRGLMPHLVERLPAAIDYYYELFAGGGALFYEVQRRYPGLKCALLNDVNSELVTTYRVVRDWPDELIDLLRQCHARHDKDHYYQVRAQHDLTDNLKIAARLLYLNRTCFNGLYRVNRRGEFNVPIGRYKNPAIVQADNIAACSRALRRTILSTSQFFDVFACSEPNTFVYLDPPYDATFTSYASGGFTSDDQERVRDFAWRLADRGIKVMLSNSDTPLIRELYDCEPFTVSTVSAPRSCSGKASGRKAAQEVIITTY